MNFVVKNVLSEKTKQKRIQKFKPDCKTNIVPIVCHSQCELGNLFGGKDILNVRIKTQTMEFAGDNHKTD